MGLRIQIYVPVDPVDETDEKTDTEERDKVTDETDKVIYISKKTEFDYRTKNVNYIEKTQKTSSSSSDWINDSET